MAVFRLVAVFAQSLRLLNGGNQVVRVVRHATRRMAREGVDDRMLRGELLPDAAGLDDLWRSLRVQRIVGSWVPARVLAPLLAAEIEARIGRATFEDTTVRALKLDVQVP